MKVSVHGRVALAATAKGHEDAKRLGRLKRGTWLFLTVQMVQEFTGLPADEGHLYIYERQYVAARNGLI